MILARMMQSHEAHITNMLKSYEENITRVLTGRQGIGISDRWMKFLFIFFFAFMLVVTLYVKFR